jgi:hypothetical protein
MDLFALRRPCPVKYEVYLTGVNGRQKKDNPLRSLRLCGELLQKKELKNELRQPRFGN